MVKDKKALIGVGCVPFPRPSKCLTNFDARPISPVFLLIAFHEGSSPWSKNWFTQICSLQMCRKSINLRNKYWAKVVNAIFAKSFTPPIQMWHLSSLPHIYSSVFTFLRYICMERICANPLFSSSVGDKTQLLPEQKKVSLYWRFNAYCRPFCLENCLVVYLVLWRLSLDSSKCFSITSVYEEFNIHSDCS